ncbi:hypothetical protein [Bacillus sp. LR_6]|uniref:hypothetical protein n=1 Tax=Bacillus sp. LR_6 TaxID=3055785 RepID=UPI0035BFF59B
MNKKIESLKNFIIQNIDIMEPSGGFGAHLSYPEFDLTPRDFLEYAKIELQHSVSNPGSPIHIINCVSHLKRAIDCQLDVFLSQLSLYNLIKEQNLKFEKKLNFLKDAGIIEANSIARLNQIRNKLEHEYKIPDIVEIEVYYDLACAFITVLEATTIFFFFYNEIEIESNNLEKFKFLRISYHFDTVPYISFEVFYNDNTENLCIEAKASEFKVFPYYLKALLQLSKLGYTKNEFIIKELQYN